MFFVSVLRFIFLNPLLNFFLCRPNGKFNVGGGAENAYGTSQHVEFSKDKVYETSPFARIPLSGVSLNVRSGLLSGAKRISTANMNGISAVSPESPHAHIPMVTPTRISSLTGSKTAEHQR
jgi:hypothetical protein